jgi:hypothetical protein
VAVASTCPRTTSPENVPLIENVPESLGLLCPLVERRFVFAKPPSVRIVADTRNELNSAR